MRLPRQGTLTAVVLTAALAVTGCGGGSTSTAVRSTLGGTLEGAGSTVQRPALDRAVSTVAHTEPSELVHYAATGSAAGLAAFTAGQADFAGSDTPLGTLPVHGVTPAEAARIRCGGNAAWDLPMMAAPIAIGYDLPGVSDLNLTPHLLGQIFLGAITTWNDPALAEQNPGVALPAVRIIVLGSADSGVTQNFENYLATADPVDFPTARSGRSARSDRSGRKGAAVKSRPVPPVGTTAEIAGTVGAIGDVGWPSVTGTKLTVARIDDGAGPVALTEDTTEQAIAAARPVDSTSFADIGNDLRLKLPWRTTTAGVYPIMMVTYEVVCSKGLAFQRTQLLKTFLRDLADPRTQADLGDLGYEPLPGALQAKVAAAIEAIG